MVVLSHPFTPRGFGRYDDSSGTGSGEGDLMKSIYLLMYKAEEGVLEIRAKDFHSNYMTAVDILDDDTYLGAEINYNLFTVRKNSDAASDEDRNRLEVSFGHGVYS